MGLGEGDRSGSTASTTRRGRKRPDSSQSLRVLSELPDQQKLVFRMSRIDGLTSREISEQIKNEALEDPYMMKNKYTTYQEYMLFGDPALKLYMPD